jgi:hypothetical protein
MREAGEADRPFPAGTRRLARRSAGGRDDHPGEENRRRDAGADQPAGDDVQADNFWTSHFGGVYIFRDVRFAAAISSLDWRSLGEVPVAQVMDLTHRNQIADWLERNNLVEPIVQARGTDGAAILRQKMDFILVDAADRLGIWTWATRGGRNCGRSPTASAPRCRRNSWGWRRC